MSEEQIKKQIRTILNECGVRSSDPQQLKDRLLSLIIRRRERCELKMFKDNQHSKGVDVSAMPKCADCRTAPCFCSML